MKRQGGLEFLRIIAATFILLHHFQQILGQPFVHGINFYYGTFFYGSMVEFFFLLSGFVFFTKNIDNSRVEQYPFIAFMKGKLVRLLPIMAISAIAYEILCYLYNCSFSGVKEWMFSTKIDIIGTIETCLGIQAGGAFNPTTINNPTWYVSVLIICYVFAYFLIYLEEKHKLPILYSAAVMVFIGVSILSYEIDLPYLNFYAARGYRAFFFGILLKKYFEKQGQWRIKGVITGIALIVVSCYVFWNFPEWMDNFTGNYLVFIFFPILIGIMTSKTKFAKLFDNKFFQNCGRITYDVYIWHCPLLLIIVILLNRGFNIDVLSYESQFIFVLVAYLVGAISYFGISKPLNNYYNKKKLTRNVE